jgi:hypothetical protein
LKISSDELYGELWAEEPSELEAALGRSLAPRATTMLYDEFAGLGVGPENLVLDAGARDAVHAIELVQRLGCRVIAVDPVPLHFERARGRVATAGLRIGSRSSRQGSSLFHSRTHRSITSGAGTS